MTTVRGSSPGAASGAGAQGPVVEVPAPHQEAALQSSVAVGDPPPNPPAPTPEDRPDEARLPDASEVPTDRRKRFPGRLVVVLVVGSILVLLALDIVMGRLAYNVRQDHLASLYNDTSTELPEQGAPVLALQIEDLEVNTIVAEGADAGTLRGGPGLQAGSPLPSEGGNVVILGRSDRFGAPFATIESLAEGTVIVTRSREGQVAEYEVEDTETVDGDDLDAMVQGEQDRLTLVTSAGGPLNSSRVVVTASLVGISEDLTATDGDGGSASTEGESDDPAAAEAREEAESEVVEAAGSGTSESGTDEAPVRDPGDAPESWDVRAGGTWVLLLAGLVSIVAGALAWSDLRRRHPVSTSAAVAGPAIALGVMLALFNMDAILPATF